MYRGAVRLRVRLLAPWLAVQDYPTIAGDEPAAPHWWSIAPDPVLPAISTKRAYFEVLFVFLVMFATGILAAGLLLAGHYKVSAEPAPGGSNVPVKYRKPETSGLVVDAGKSLEKDWEMR